MITIQNKITDEVVTLREGAQELQAHFVEPLKTYNKILWMKVGEVDETRNEEERLRAWLKIVSMSDVENEQFKELKKLYLSDEIWWTVKSGTDKDFRQWLAYQALEGK